MAIDGIGLLLGGLGGGAVAGLGELLLLLPAGWVSDRIGRLSALLPGLGILALAGVAVPLGGSPALFPALNFLMGVGFSIWMLPATLLSDRAGSPTPPLAVSLLRLGMGTGMMGGPILATALASRAGYLAATASFGLALGVAGCAVAWTARSRAPKTPTAHRG